MTAALGAAPDLEVRAATKRFGTHLAVDEVSFSVSRGSFFSILGPSGCGKTTLLRMIAGFIQPDRGTIAIGGRDMARVAPNKRPAQNVAFGLARRGVGRTERLRHAEAMLERVGLAGAGGKRIEELSGGQRQRVAIARSMVLEPTLLLLDEPLGALDLKLREHMKVELKQLQSAFGTTFVYITHDQSEALVLSDQVGVMNHGRFEQLATPQELYYSPATSFVAGFVGANNRVAGSALAVDGALVELGTPGGWVMRARRLGAIARDGAVEAFIRPEVITLGRTPAELPAGQGPYAAEVLSLLFDGANSAVLLREVRSRSELRVALPQTGSHADLGAGARVYFSFDPERALCFAASGARV